MIWHVIPNKDTKPHVDVSINDICVCECDPKHQHYDNGNTLVVHNSFDGREGVEWANEILNTL